MIFTRDRKISEAFRSATRDAEVRKYLASDEFLDQMREAIKDDIIRRGVSYGSFGSSVSLMISASERRFDEHYMPVLQAAFLKIKTEHPELDHIRVNRQGRVILDTRPNTWRRRKIASDITYDDC